MSHLDSLVSEIEARICEIAGASECELQEEIQSLWSGYGVIRRAKIDDQTVIIKHIDISSVRENRRGWGSDFAHQRKVKSYQVEEGFYKKYAGLCDSLCRLPRLIGSDFDDNRAWLLVLEDLDNAGFPNRKSNLNDLELVAGLNWLANFHAKFMGIQPEGLWDVGTYWHLATRPDEFAAMPDGKLKTAAPLIDRALNLASYKTLVHGDAKVANFCFSQNDLGAVAAVDFQYVGGGCGMKDVAYFISSCLYEDEARQREEELLSIYFDQLEKSLLKLKKMIDFRSLKTEWLELYSVAWADFYRFLAGWSPGHWKMNQYSEQLTNDVIEKLGVD